MLNTCDMPIKKQEGDKEGEKSLITIQVTGGFNKQVNSNNKVLYQVWTEYVWELNFSAWANAVLMRIAGSQHRAGDLRENSI